MPRSTPLIQGCWTSQLLVKELDIAVGTCVEPSTSTAYASALCSYTSFCAIHEFPLTLTPQTLTFYIVYMAHYINPRSIESATYQESVTLSKHVILKYENHVVTHSSSKPLKGAKN
jgi:hypothetical protein